jgi:hypothetical protein
LPNVDLGFAKRLPMGFPPYDHGEFDVLWADRIDAFTKVGRHIDAALLMKDSDAVVAGEWALGHARGITALPLNLKGVQGRGLEDIEEVDHVTV